MILNIKHNCVFPFGFRRNITASSYIRLETVRSAVRPTSRSTEKSTASDSSSEGNQERTDSRKASVRARVAAYLLDLLVVGGSVVGVAGRLGDSSGERLCLGGLLGLAVANLHHVVLEGSSGQTVGKRTVGIAVEMDDGEQCAYGPAAVRTGFRFVDWLPVGYLLGFASLAVTERKKRLGDVAAKTVVVRVRSDSERRLW
jgi:uncharacterized RDD family membrane protein YckC